MLPFARMVKYGNTAVNTIEIKKIRYGTDSTLALSTKGDLYGRGSGAFGDGNVNTFREDWVLVHRAVEDFWCNDNQRLIYIQTTDKKLFWCGMKKYRTGGSDTTSSTEFTEESTISTMGIKKILFNESYTSVLALTTSGSVYIIGSPRAWNGVVTATSNWTTMASNIIDVFCTSTNYFTLATNGVVNGGGQNISGILNTSSASSTFYAWPISIGTSNTASPSITSGQYSMKFKSNLNVMVGRGYGWSGFFGNGSNQDLSNTTTISTTWPNFSSMIRQSDPPIGTPNKSYYYTTNGKLYFMGSPTRSGSTSTSTVYSPEELVVPFNAADIIYIQVSNSFVYVYLNDARMYQVGIRYTSSTSSVDYTQFTEVESSYFSNFSIKITRDDML